MGRFASHLLALRPSVSLTAFLFVGHGVAMAAVWPLMAVVPLLWLLPVLLLISLAVQCWKVWHPPVPLLGMEGRTLQLGMADGSWLEGLVLAHSVVLPWLIVLHIRIDRCRRDKVFVLPIDALGKESHRMLRRWVLWQSQERVVPNQKP